MQGIDRLIATTAKLRAPDGCPWDREQTHRSICDALVEEVAEVLQAIDKNDVPNLREELGDLLFHVVLHAQMATEAGQFNFDEVANEVTDKMIRRHPHVFGQGNKLGDSAAVIQQWEQIKLKEKGNRPVSLFKDLPPSLSSILQARDVWKHIHKKNLNTGNLISQKNIEDNRKDLTESDAGKKLFELIAACRNAGIDPDSALRRFTQNVKDEAEKNNAPQA
jgi:MazG family protein